MERRDYLMDQIHELGLFIAKLMGTLQKKVEAGEEDKMLDEAKDAFSIQFGLDLEDLLFMDEAGFVNLMEENLLADEHFEKMAEVFETLGDHAFEHQTVLRKSLYFQKSLLLLHYIEGKSHSYSMERAESIVRIESKMKL